MLLKIVSIANIILEIIIYIEICWEFGMSSGTILLITGLIVWVLIKITYGNKNNGSKRIYNNIDDNGEKLAQSIRDDRENRKNLGTISMSKNYGDNYPVSKPQKISIGIPQRNITKPEHIKKFQHYTVIDFETTGLSPNDSEIIEIGAVKLHGDTLEPHNTFHSFVRPNSPISKRITSINNITNEMVDNAPHISKAIVELIDFIGNDCIIAHNAPFDMKFLVSAAQNHGVEIRAKGYVCTLKMARSLLTLENHKLPTVAKHFGIEFNPHRAVDDCVATGHVFSKMCKLI